MEIYHLAHDVKVFGTAVPEFPNGIETAFRKLMNSVEGGWNRSYYGVSFMKEGKMIYLATTGEKEQGEAQKKSFEYYTIEKGEYLVKPLKDWRSKTNTITGIFEEMMQDQRVDRNKPAVEWYKTEQEMFCMLRTKS